MVIDWKRVFEAGIGAGLVFIVVEMVLVGITQGTPFGPPRMIAAIGMGEGVLPPPPSFDLGIFLVAMLIHFLLSLILAAIYAVTFARFGRSFLVAAIIGAVFGLIVYLVNFYGFTALFPWFENARNWITILAHIVFGVALGMLLPAPRVDETIHGETPAV